MPRMAQRKTLLIVDDDQDLRGAIAEQLQAEGFETLEAETAAEGIRLATEAKPDLAGRYRISAIPTLILFKGGREVHRMQGAAPLAHLQREFAEFL